MENEQMEQGTIKMEKTGGNKNGEDDKTSE